MRGWSCRADSCGEHLAITLHPLKTLLSPSPALLVCVSYMLRVYLRTRLHKLESQAAHILGDNELTSRLSPKEQEYTQV